MDASRVPLIDVIAYIEAALEEGGRTIEIDVLDPDMAHVDAVPGPNAAHVDAAVSLAVPGPNTAQSRVARETRTASRRSRYAGEEVDIGGARYLHRPLRVWIDLAERLGLRLFTPRATTPPLLRLRFEPLDPAARMTGDIDAGNEKYGIESEFARIRKLEEPGFVIDMRDALERVSPAASWRVLYLGCNTGDEIALVSALSPTLRVATHVGIDHSESAIAAARARFGDRSNVEFHLSDIAHLGELALGRFDLVISIGTLQSAGIDDRELLRELVQDHLAPGGAVILGIPNCRYIDGEVEYGARMKNFRQPELGLLVKDVAFYRKYLQQHHKQVFVTGKHYLLVTARETE